MSLTEALTKIEEAKISNAVELDLAGLELLEIPEEISKLTQLIALNLNQNQLTKVKGLDNLTELCILQLNDNKLFEINGLENLKKLNYLNLGSNQLVEIKGLETLTELTYLNLGYNQLVEIKGLERLTKLTSLTLTNNTIEEITGLGTLTKLIFLSLSHNLIAEIKGLETLTRLDYLGLYNNNIKEIKGLETLANLTELDLDNNEITEIKELEKITGLTQLHLSYNKLTEIKNLEKLTKLTQLSLDDNKIKEIKGLEKLRQLTRLDLSDNDLKEIKGLEKLRKLTFLDLGINGITEIKGLEELTQLTELDLGFNKITEIKGLEKLTKLTILSLLHNELKEIKGLQILTNLISLRLQNNKLTEIPKFLLELGQPICKEIKYHASGVSIGNNPIITPPYDIVEQGDSAIREYFNQLKKSGEEPLNEAKLILLGDARAGKTSFANRLIGKELPKEADRTQGVDIVIGAYGFPLVNGKNFKINIWDFAGHDKYKTLHQLFYTESSLYVMVAESGNMTTDFDDWFQTAELFGEGSPLILVLNEFKTGIGMGSFDDTYWKKQFPRLLKEVFTVDLETKQNFALAEDYIQLLAQTLPHSKSPFPANWTAIRRVLNERRDEQYITLKEYLDICKNNNLPERESALVLSSILHKVGDCLHYQKSDLLKRIIILKNEWATEAVYKILDDSVVATKQCGFFNLQDLERIWRADEYLDMRPELLELMMQFKLAYQLPGKEEFVTPPLLPTTRPNHFSWPNEESLELYIEYEFLPKALLTQFIITRHADIAEERTLVWRHGVILKWESEALAEVSKIKLEGRDAFHIRSQGNNRKGMMTIILKTFRELHADYKGIKYKEKVPCTCEGCKMGKNKQGYFDFEMLNKRIEKGKDDVDCEKSVESVNMMELLENTFVLERVKGMHTPQLKENVTRKKSSETKRLNIFLASSNELVEERKEIEQALGRKNKLWREDGFDIELLIWEDGKHIGTSTRSQNNYNLEIEQCDVFAMLFYSKVGKYSLEEFELAHSLFGDNAMPRICIFQKDIDLPKNQRRADSDSRHDFLDRLNKMEHFPILFQNTDKLINELEHAIDKLLRDEAFIGRLGVE